MLCSCCSCCDREGTWAAVAAVAVGGEARPSAMGGVVDGDLPNRNRGGEMVFGCCCLSQGPESLAVSACPPLSAVPPSSRNQWACNNCAALGLSPGLWHSSAWISQRAGSEMEARMGKEKRWARMRRSRATGEGLASKKG